jgi:hypothetical protein
MKATHPQPLSHGEGDIFWGEMAPCEHLVQIYENDDVFMDTLEGFISGAIVAGDAAVVIATPGHRDALARRLEARGLNLSAAREKDRYIDLDAEHTLAHFMVAGWPDNVLFERTIARIIARAGQGGRRVRAFGEMVAILWASGNAAATIRLEHLWHRLCQTKIFSLFCAYPRSGFTQDTRSSMEQICAAHSKVLTGYAPLGWVLTNSPDTGPPASRKASGSCA